MSKYNSTKELLDDILKYILLGITPSGSTLDIRGDVNNKIDINTNFNDIYEMTFDKLNSYGRKYQVLIEAGMDSEEAEYQVKRTTEYPIPILEVLHADSRDDFLDLIFEYFELDEEE